MLIKNDQQWKGDGLSLSDLGFWDLRLRAQLGRDLRSQYEAFMDEPMPERLAVLVRDLEKEERARNSELDHASD